MSWCGLAWSGRKSVVMSVVSVMLLILAQRSSARPQAPDEGAAAAGVAKGYAVEKLVAGNGAGGKAYFEGAGGCNKCHGAGGDLAGIAGKHSPIDLEARMLYPEGKATTAVVTLSSGEQVKGEVK